MDGKGFFLFERIDKGHLLFDHVFALRYKVFCEEWGFEDPREHPEGFEKDRYDAAAVFVGAIENCTNKLIGTSRLVLDAPAGFPVEAHMQITTDLSGIARKNIGEISRLAVSKEYRRRAEDRVLDQAGTGPPVLSEDAGQKKRRRENDIVMGVFGELCYQSGVEGLTYWFAAMARGLWLILKKRGIVFPSAGPEMDYHGLRRPYFGEIEEVLAGCRPLLERYYEGQSHASKVGAHG